MPAKRTLFRSALPRGERHGTLTLEDVARLFRSALPRGERRPIDGGTGRSTGFDPRSRAGSVVINKPDNAIHTVSIRAPARGASTEELRLKLADPFRSALPRGERPAPGQRLNWTIPFRSALPRGERLQPEQDQGPVQCFDPRSRAGSVSAQTHSRWRLLKQCFDPRSRAGSVMRLDTMGAATASFDPRSRAGSVMPKTRARSVGTSFDPRSRAGSVVQSCGIIVDAIVSIRAPARGASRGATRPIGARQVSIRAPARGASNTSR